jgi:transposase
MSPYWSACIDRRAIRPATSPAALSASLPKRWIIERTFAWISRWRRNAKDGERKPEHSEAMST